MYIVVKTIEQGKTFFCTVPMPWVNENILYFPTSDWKKHRNKMSEPELDWNRYECIIKGKPFRVLEDALHEEKQLCKFVDTEEEEEHFNNKREKRAHPVKCVSWPQYKNYNTTMANILESSQTSNDNTRSEDTISSESSLPTSSVISSVYVCESEDFEENNVNERTMVNDELSDTNLYLASNVNIDNKFQEILEDNAKIHAKLDKVLNILENRVIMAPNTVNSLEINEENAEGLEELNFPLKSVEAMNELNKKLLENKNFFHRVFNLLRKEFSFKAEWKKVAYILVDNIFERNLLTKYTWTGSSKAKSKQGFMSLLGINKLFYNVVKNSDSNYNQMNHEDFFKNCVLKYSDLRAIPKKIQRTSAPRTSAPKKKRILDLEIDQQETDEDIDGECKVSNKENEGSEDNSA